MDDHFGVGVSVEMMTAAFQFAAELWKVVYLSVVDNADSFVFVENRLAPSGKVDDTEPPHPQTCPVLYEDTFLVRSPMNDTLAHPMDGRCFNSSTLRADHPSD